MTSKHFFKSLGFFYVSFIQLMIILSSVSSINHCGFIVFTAENNQAVLTFTANC